MGVDDPATLEAITCREALALAQDLQLHNFIIASDSKQVIGDIGKGSRGSYGAIIREVKTRTALFHCNFTFKCRASNSEAHSLANIFFVSL